jgi:hypothetical protein
MRDKLVNIRKAAEALLDDNPGTVDVVESYTVPNDYRTRSRMTHYIQPLKCNGGRFTLKPSSDQLFRKLNAAYYPVDTQLHARRPLSCTIDFRSQKHQLILI